MISMPATAKPSSPAKAGDPVIRSASDGIEKPRRTGYPACAGYDDCGSGGGPATFPVVAAFAGTTVELPPLPALSRGEGRGEGLSPRARFAERAPHPKFAFANFDLSPQAGRGAPNAQQRSVTSPSPRSSVWTGDIEDSFSDPFGDIEDTCRPRVVGRGDASMAWRELSVHDQTNVQSIFRVSTSSESEVPSRVMASLGSSLTFTRRSSHALPF